MEKIIAIPFLLLLPGWSLYLAIFGPKRNTDGIETVGLSAVLSITAVSGIVFAMSMVGIRISKTTLIGAVLLFSFACIFIFLGRKIQTKKNEK